MTTVKGKKTSEIKVDMTALKDLSDHELLLAILALVVELRDIVTEEKKCR